jgi:uncharacterized membrane protein
MKEDRPIMSPAFRVASIAVLAAVTFVLTSVVKIPTTPGNYFNLGDVVIVFTALIFGPYSAALAGGLGTSLADLLSGSYAFWAPYTLVAHGLQGLVIGLIVRVRPGNIVLAAVASVVGIVIMAGGYFIAGLILYGLYPSLATIPANLLQGGVGVVLGLLVAATVERAYPPVRQWKW